VLDALFATRVGGGLLVVSCFDHWGVAGRRLLRRTVAWAAQTPAEAGADRDCPPAALRAMRHPGCTRPAPGSRPAPPGRALQARPPRRSSGVIPHSVTPIPIASAIAALAASARRAEASPSA